MTDAERIAELEAKVKDLEAGLMWLVDIVMGPQGEPEPLEASHVAFLDRVRERRARNRRAQEVV